MLARVILDHPALVRNKSVLDLGSGCGAVTLACVMSGARHVTANDIDTASETALRVNSELNNLNLSEKVKFISDNLLESDNLNILNNYDVILVGDMFYDQEIGDSVVSLCRNFKQTGDDKDVLVGDPGRWFLETSDIRDTSCVAKYNLPEETRKENYGFHQGVVWRMK